MKSPLYISQQKLAKKLSKGDTKAFEQVYYLFKDKLYGYCLKLLASEELSKEIVQETFVRLWEKRERIDADKSLSAYLYTIAKNQIKDHQARYSREFEMNHPFQAAEFSENTIEENLTFLEIKKIEEKVVDELSPQQRNVYKLSRYKQLSHQEIADKMGISVNSVKTHLRLALKTLRTHIAPMTDFLLIVIAILMNR
ncbi:RNA polymerase sigma-70 factor [Rapidithrix thailandica]|uniref:RNA polymerase sigma-70 factor n=1 Tax=Rapidithrix thailandica TaxID=413964 RepID=A0AAW9SFF9_9BACT